VPDETLERRQLWRHLMQCVLAEHDARTAYHAAPMEQRDACERRLTAEGVRVNAAIEALDETLLPVRRSA
jgi:hypothetical protein